MFNIKGTSRKFIQVTRKKNDEIFIVDIDSIWAFDHSYDYGSYLYLTHPYFGKNIIEITESIETIKEMLQFVVI